jgi:hypothetical protein
MGTLLVRLRVSPSGTFQVAEDRDSRRPSLERRRSRLKASRGPPDGLGLDNGEDGATLPEPGSK